MPYEPWRDALDRALDLCRHSPQHRFVQLATIGLDGRPAVRTVVFRGFHNASRDLIFTTDARSAKFAEIEKTPAAALCWYFLETREQFRLSGVVRLVDALATEPHLSEARSDAWRALSDETRASFAWPAPGVGRVPGEAFPSTAPDPESPVDNFALMIFVVHEVDHLQLDGAPQNRWKYEVDENGRWLTREVNP